MTEKKMRELKDKVADYKRFGFILLSLSAFLFIGLIIPADGQAVSLPSGFIVGVFLTMGLAVVCHRLAMNAQKQMYEDE
ncbi:YrhC family protein [Alkalihalophilus pseudofirmus]|uniref:YrhC family protein n=1 Tax=Alkalihalophilus pseudofirmus TaxID=79885 RepID=A0AAJ2KRY4_ALKPS|nr:YrhC family protein [Alkalihalophilus pseudofirmus]MDV2883767.1 YrhC family protein [Alkalihalophilus pseudofirmus]WEG17874.1 YrhC family protein [Alkalihalophilus pseudofirmus]